MFEKFTDKARKVMSLAQDEARGLGQMYVGTEHLLLALIKEGEGVAAQALAKLDVTYDETLATVRELTTSENEPVPGGHIPFTPRAKRVLEGAYRETMTHGQTYIATEHLLLGIVAEGNGRAMDALRQMGVSGDAVRNAVSDLAGKHPETATPASADVRAGSFIGGPGPQQQGEDGSVLEQYGRNLTKLAADGRLDPVIGRDREIERVMQVLARRQKNNPLILGDPGVGKTAIVEGLAQLIAGGNVPDILRGKQVWTLDLASLVAGSKYRGEFEERMKKVVRELEEALARHPIRAQPRNVERTDAKQRGEALSFRGAPRGKRPFDAPCGFIRRRAAEREGKPNGVLVVRRFGFERRERRRARKPFAGGARALGAREVGPALEPGLGESGSGNGGVAHAFDEFERKSGTRHFRTAHSTKREKGRRGERFEAGRQFLPAAPSVALGSATPKRAENSLPPHMECPLDSSGAAEEGSWRNGCRRSESRGPFRSTAVGRLRVWCGRVSEIRPIFQGNHH